MTQSYPIENKLIVTTSVGKRPNLIAKAKEIALRFDAPYAVRENRGLSFLFTQHDAVRAIVVETDGLALAHVDGTVYRYHPNLGLVRALNMLRGQRDLFADAVLLEQGQSMLDCTLGFASESILAAIIVGDTGRVVGLESNPELAFVTERGLKERPMVQKRMITPMRMIDVVCADYNDYIHALEPFVFNVIYFDPFFNERIERSEINIDPLFRFGNTTPLCAETVIMAISKANCRVVVKHPRDIPLPPQLAHLVTRVISRAHGPIGYSVFERLS